MNTVRDLIADWPLVVRIIALVGIAALAHMLVLLLRRFSSSFVHNVGDRRFRKLRSVGTLATSIAMFIVYFLAFGLILRELGVSLTAYLASASVLGLAIGFGSQGVVQDVVTGLTFIFSDLVDVGDLVEISGQTGIVRSISMRFVELRNALGASVFIPNRTINNVINYPRGYVRCIVDVTLRGDGDAKQAAEEIALSLMRATHQQFPGILMTEPSSEGRLALGSGKDILRLKFRIWPNRGQPIETTFVQELTAELRKKDTDYQPWMIAVSYEVEERPPTSQRRLWPLAKRPTDR